RAQRPAGQQKPRLFGIHRACATLPSRARYLTRRNAARREAVTRGIDKPPGQFGNPPKSQVFRRRV
ncbi:MAG: hypothetical protein WBD65_06030, partial [Methylocella sp.]